MTPKEFEPFYHINLTLCSKCWPRVLEMLDDYEWVTHFPDTSNEYECDFCGRFPKSPSVGNKPMTTWQILNSIEPLRKLRARFEAKGLTIIKNEKPKKE